LIRLVYALIEDYIYDRLHQYRVGTMWFIWVGVAMIVLKVLEISVFSELSWWWVALPFGVGFLWFELVEKRLGMDKKKAFDEIDKAKKERIKKRLEIDKNPRARR
jgi:small Trp-rich protein